jgi:hypothetical protein
VCWSITRVSPWLLCNVPFVQSTQRTIARGLAYLKTRIIAAVKNIDEPMLTRVCGKKNTVSMCVVSLVVYTSNRSNCQKSFYSFPMAVNNYIKVGPLVYLLLTLVIMENITKRPVQHQHVMH